MKNLVWAAASVAVCIVMNPAVRAAEGDIPPPDVIQAVVTVEATWPEAYEPIPYSLAPERPAIFTVTRTGPTVEPLTVYFLLGGDAVNGEDYHTVLEEATIPVGEASVMVYISALSDGVREGDESVTLQVVPPVCIAIYPPPYACYLTGDPDLARAVIHDNGIVVQPQPVVNIVAVDPIASEQSPLVDALPDSAAFQVVRRGSTDSALQVDYAIRGSAENGVDYVDEAGLPLSGRIVIAKGEEVATLIIAAIDDNLPEHTESVVLELTPLACPKIWPPPPWCYVVGEHPVAEAVIHDNDPPANQLPSVAIAHPAVGATFEAPASIPVVVHVNDPDGWVHTVELFANDRKIDEQSIYFFAPPPPGQDQVFEFRWDPVPTGEYALWARATDDAGGRAHSDAVPIVVREAPAIPVVNIWATDPFAREEWAPHHLPNRARFRVRRNWPIAQPLTVDYEIAGTAVNGEDYERIPGQVTIPAGRFSAPIDIVPIDDDVPEGLESVILRLYVAVDVEPPPYQVGRRGRAGAVIFDHDAAPPHCRFLHDGLVYLCRPAVNGEIFDVQVADRLDGEWESLGTFTVQDGALHVADLDAASHPCRYYRFVPVATNAIAADD